MSLRDQSGLLDPALSLANRLTGSVAPACGHLQEVRIVTYIVVWVVVLRCEYQQDRIGRVAVLRRPGEGRQKKPPRWRIQDKLVAVSSIIDRNPTRTGDANHELRAHAMR